jgi:hypothetical protein
VFSNIHPARDNDFFQFNINRWWKYIMELTKTTNFRAYHFENDGASGLVMNTVYDLAQSTAEIYLTQDVGNDSRL